MLKLYTDESPGLKVDPVVVLVLSLAFIFSVVALHGEFIIFGSFGAWGEMGLMVGGSYCEAYAQVFGISCGAAGCGSTGGWRKVVRGDVEVLDPGDDPTTKGKRFFNGAFIQVLGSFWHR